VSTQPPTRLASEDVIISAPMSYTGSARRIMRIRHRAEGDGSRVGIAVLAVLLVLVVWVFVTVWYLVWGIWLVPYRVVRRGSRTVTSTETARLTNFADTCSRADLPRWSSRSVSARCTQRGRGQISERSEAICR
jgi:uncharacterized membrane-anchored protein